MKILNKITVSLLVASSPIHADLSVDSIGLNAGSSQINTKQTNLVGSITLANEPDAQYIHGELYALIGGFFEDKSYKPSVHYLLSKNSEFTNHLFMAGINKYFLFEDYHLYAGLLVGQGILNWKYNPISGTNDNDKNLQSIVGALQVGAEYKVTEHFSLGVNAKYYLHDYQTVLEPSIGASADINHNSSSSISLGMRYSFNLDK